MNSDQLKSALRAGQPLLGAQQFLPSPSVTELIGLAGFDFVMICAEHGTIGYGTELENCVRAALLFNMTPIVRVPANETHLVQGALERGAKGVVIPLVKSAADVQRAVRAAKFAPDGVRGICPMSRTFWYGPSRPETFLKDENAATCVVPLVEHIDAVDRIDGIVAVEGVDFVLLGTGDLAASLGIREKLLIGDHAARNRIEECRKRVAGACRNRGVPLAQLVYRTEEVGRLKSEGVSVFLSIPEAAIFRAALDNLVRECRAGMVAGPVSSAEMELSYGKVT